MSPTSVYFIFRKTVINDHGRNFVEGGNPFCDFKVLIKNQLLRSHSGKLVDCRHYSILRQVETVEVHNFVPCRYEVVQEFLLGVLTCVNFRKSAELGV